VFQNAELITLFNFIKEIKMNIAYTPQHIHMEFDFDTYRLIQIAMATSVMFILVALFFAPAKYSEDGNMSLQTRLVADATSSPSRQTNISKQTYSLFSTQIDASMTGDEAQPYYIPSPD
jgi:hypothetical protein